MNWNDNVNLRDGTHKQLVDFVADSVPSGRKIVRIPVELADDGLIPRNSTKAFIYSDIDLDLLKIEGFVHWNDTSAIPSQPYYTGFFEVSGNTINFIKNNLESFPTDKEINCLNVFGIPGFNLSAVKFTKIDSGFDFGFTAQNSDSDDDMYVELYILKEVEEDEVE